MRSDQKKDDALRKRLQQAVDKFAGGSADEFARKIGYTNGGYVREALNGTKKVRSAIVDRVNAAPEMSGWFDDLVQGVTTFHVKQPPAKWVAHALTLSAYNLPPIMSWEAVVSEDLPEVFRCAMPDDALKNTTPRGTMLLCSTTDEPAFGKGVIVEDVSGERFVRRYAQGRGDDWVAEADAPGYASLRASDGVRVIAVVIARFDGTV